MKGFNIILRGMVLLLIFLSISGCSSTKTISLENQVKELMMKNHSNYDSIIHLELKENIIIIFYEQNNQLKLGFINNNEGKWESVAGIGSIDLKKGGYIATGETGLPFYITVVVSPDPEVKSITVQKQNAKLVQVSPEKKVWFAFTNKPTRPIDIVEIK